MPENCHYLTLWINELLMQNIIQPHTLKFQEMDALVEVCLRYPKPVQGQGWRMWPAVSAFADYLLNQYSRHALRFYRGTQKIADNTIKGLIEFVQSVNHVSPSLTTTSYWRTPLKLESGEMHSNTRN